MTPWTFLGLEASDWIMIAAVIAGPILAVWVTRFHDSRNEKRSRQLAILRSLLKTRQLRIDPEHVGALNLIDIEFYGVKPINAAYGAYIRNLGAPFPNEHGQAAFFDERHDLFVALLHSIGTHLGYEFDKHDLGRRGYMPTAWGSEQERLAKNSALLTELLEGKRSLPVFSLHSSHGLFPPPPS